MTKTPVEILIEAKMKSGRTWPSFAIHWDVEVRTMKGYRYDGNAIPSTLIVQWINVYDIRLSKES
jgi:hypothetical protein